MNLPLIVDVRTAYEFNQQHINGAVNVSMSSWNKIRETVGEDRLTEVWLYCNSGGQSGIVKRLLEDIGYTNVRNYGTIARTQQALDYYIQQGE